MLTFTDFIFDLREWIESHSQQGLQSGSIPASKCPENFNALALRLFVLQFASNPAYRRFCEARGKSPESISYWWEIPAIPACAFKELELTSIPEGARTAVFHSSGTTEQRPSRHFHNEESLGVYEASILHWFRAHFLGEFNEKLTMLFLTPPPTLAPRSSLVHMFGAVRRAFGAPESSFAGRLDETGGWVLDLEQICRALEVFAQSRRAVAVLGTAFNYVHLFVHLARSGRRFDLPAGSGALETGGYKGRSRSLGKQELHALLTEYLGIPAEQIL